MAIGYSDWNIYTGKVDIYDRTNMTKIITIEGEDGNKMLGEEMIAVDKGNYI